MEQEPSTTSQSAPPLGELKTEHIAALVGGLVLQIAAKDMMIARLSERIEELEKLQPNS